MLYLVGASVKKGFQATVYVANTMQTAGIEEIQEKVSDTRYHLDHVLMLMLLCFTGVFGSR